jgi:hypothetical protein
MPRITRNASAKANSSELQITNSDTQTMNIDVNENVRVCLIFIFHGVFQTTGVLDTPHKQPTKAVVQKQLTKTRLEDVTNNATFTPGTGAVVSLHKRIVTACCSVDCVQLIKLLDDYAEVSGKHTHSRTCRQLPARHCTTLMNA